MSGIMKAFSNIHMALRYPLIKSKSSTSMLVRLR